MLRLFIEDKEVYLDAETNFQIYRENPLFNKVGDYTFNMTINTRNKNNSAIYSNIRKIGNHFSVKNRKARLLDGDEELLNGIEVVLSADDSTVEIQILNGSSELNYLASADNRSVRDLNFGSIGFVDNVIAKRYTEKKYPESFAAYPPIWIDNKLCNHVTLYYENYEYWEQELKPQPYLLFYTKAIIEALGYELAYNQMAEEDKWRRLLVIHGYNTKKYAKMLPNWTVSKFIDEIEKFFNAIYVVNPKKKEVSLIGIKNFYKNKEEVIIARDKILDSFNREFRSEEEKEDLYITYQNIEYNFPKEEGYERASIPDELMDRLTIENARWEEVAEGGPNTDWNNWVAYKDDRMNNFLFKPYYKYTQYDNGYSMLSTKSRINDFGRYTKDKDGNTISLSIVPAQIYCGSTVAFDQQENEISVGYYQIPYANFHEYTDKELGFYDRVKGEKEGDETEDVMKVAFLEGKAHTIYLSSVTHLGSGASPHYWMPMCWNEEWTWEEQWKDWTVPVPLTFNETYLPNFKQMTLELNGPNGRGINDFDSNFGIYHDQKYTFRFLCKEFLDPTSIFVLDGVRFVCKKLLYEWKNGKRTGIVEGDFFRIID